MNNNKYSILFILILIFFSHYSCLRASSYVEESPLIVRNLGRFSDFPDELTLMILNYPGVQKAAKDLSKDFRKIVFSNPKMPFVMVIKSPQQWQKLQEFTINIIPKIIIEYDMDSLSFKQLIQIIPNLLELRLRGTKIDTLDPLKEAKNLRSLVIPGNYIRDISCVSDMSFLNELNFVNQPIRGIPDLSKCYNLEIINGSKTKIKDVSRFSKALNLLELSLNHMTEKKITGFLPLKDLKFLKKISLIGTTYEKDEIEELKRIKPNITIIE
ncbi:MAG: hypothetical protein IBJ00_06555 [Alphaproteobacteria bacterium]|nr:hypothetical protein [Alphaproteobacteria bacterium]